MKVRCSDDHRHHFQRQVRLLYHPLPNHHRQYHHRCYLHRRYYMLMRGIPQHRSDTFRHSTCIHIHRPIHAIVEVRLPFRDWMPVSRQKQHSLPVLDDEAMTIYREEGEINQSLSFSSSG